MNFLFFSPVVWEYYLSHHHELPIHLANREGNSCIYVNPIRYKNWEKGSIRLQSLSKHSPKKVKIIERFSRLSKSALLLIYESINNVSIVMKNKPDVVVSFDHLTCLFTCIYCKLSRIKFVLYILDNWDEMEKNKLTRFYYKHLIKPVVGKLSYAIVSLSSKQANLYKHYNSNVRIIPNGKSLQFVKSTEEFINPVTNLVNFFSQLRDWYDFDLLFNVFREFPEIELNIYGVGEMYEQLKKDAEKYPNIHVRGNADFSLLPKLSAESLFGIIPLKQIPINDSTSPAKLFDYWAAKKAVIATPTEELKKIGGTSLLFASTKAEFVSAIRLLLNNRPLKEKLGQEGYKKIMEKYNYEIISAEFENFLK